MHLLMEFYNNKPWEHIEISVHESVIMVMEILICTLKLSIITLVLYNKNVLISDRHHCSYSLCVYKYNVFCILHSASIRYIHNLLGIMQLTARSINRPC